MVRSFLCSNLSALKNVLKRWLKHFKSVNKWRKNRHSGIVIRRQQGRTEADVAGVRLTILSSPLLEMVMPHE
jgi:hypothetical protein